MSILRRALNTSAELYNWDISAAYGTTFRIYDPSPSANQDSEAIEKARRDPVAVQALRHRQQMIAGRTWHVEPASDADDDVMLAQIVTQLLGFIKRFGVTRFRLAEAFLVGATYEFVEGEFRAIRLHGDERARHWWCPTNTKAVDKRRFRQVITHEKSIKWELWSIWDREWRDCEHPEWFIKHQYDLREDTLGYAQGLLEAAYTYLRNKQIALENMMQGLERWAQGWVTMKLASLREASTGKTNSDLQDDTQEELLKMRSYGVFTYGNDDELEVINAPTGGHQICTDAITYYDNCLTRLILGSLLPTGGGGESSGSFARAETEAEQTEVVIQFDQQMMDDTLTSDLIGLILKVNAPVLREMGLEGAGRPRFRSVREKIKNPMERAQLIKEALAAGIPLVKSWVYAQIDAPEPTEDDDVIEPQVAQGMGAPGFSLGGLAEELDFGKSEEEPRREAMSRRPAMARRGLTRRLLTYAPDGTLTGSVEEPVDGDYENTPLIYRRLERDDQGRITGLVERQIEEAS